MNLSQPQRQRGRFRMADIQKLLETRKELVQRGYKYIEGDGYRPHWRAPDGSAFQYAEDALEHAQTANPQLGIKP